MSEASALRVDVALTPSEIRYILGIRINVMPGSQVIEELDARIRAGRTGRLAFVNANLANVTLGNDVLRRGLSSFLVVNDGVGIDIASLMFYGKKFPDNLVGTDFIPRFLDQSRLSLRLALIGGSEPVLAKTIDVIRHRWPRHEIVFAHHGYFGAAEEDGIADAMARTHAHIVLVAMGNPRQELWLLRNIPKACSIGAGVGALFDYLAEAVPRAPAFMLRWRLEWVYRLWVEPGRLWRRYLVGNFVFMARIIREWCERKLLGRPVNEPA